MGANDNLMQRLKASLACFSSSAVVDVADYSEDAPVSAKVKAMEMAQKSGSCSLKEDGRLKEEKEKKKKKRENREQERKKGMEWEQSGGLGARYFQTSMHTGAFL